MRESSPAGFCTYVVPFYFLASASNRGRARQPCGVRPFGARRHGATMRIPHPGQSVPMRSAPEHVVGASRASGCHARKPALAPNAHQSPPSRLRGIGRQIAADLEAGGVTQGRRTGTSIFPLPRSKSCTCKPCEQRGVRVPGTNTHAATRPSNRSVGQRCPRHSQGSYL